MDKLFEINDYELLSKKVYRILKARIIKGDLTQGGKLFEAKIAEQLGVSRTPVREAIKGLAAEGLVKMTPNQGVVVINVSIEDLQEVLQIRRVLEGLAASIAAEKISQEEIAKLEEIIKKMSMIISKPKPDVVAYSELNAEFHNLILNACGNKRLMKICNNLSSSDHRFRIRSLRNNPGRLKYSLKEHQEIVEALKRKDPEQADRLSQIHINNVLKNILENESKEENKNKDA
ncbi:MAG: GntR family transcriptional regulator [Bacteroidetes bacterium]|nr:GntR family transcriptional regulator [Bacteroidota bacterium]